MTNQHADEESPWCRSGVLPAGRRSRRMRSRRGGGRRVRRLVRVRLLLPGRRRLRPASTPATAPGTAFTTPFAGRGVKQRRPVPTAARRRATSVRGAVAQAIRQTAMGIIGVRRAGRGDQPHWHPGVRQRLRRRADRVQRVPAAVRRDRRRNGRRSVDPQRLRRELRRVDDRSRWGTARRSPTSRTRRPAARRLSSPARRARGRSAIRSRRRRRGSPSPTNGEVQRFTSGGTMTSDRTYTGTQTYSSVSLADGTYTVGGTLNVQDQAGGSAVLTGTGLTRADGCCKPTGGTLSSHTDGRQVARAAHLDLHGHVRVGDPGRKDRHAACLPVTHRPVPHATQGVCGTVA